MKTQKQIRKEIAQLKRDAKSYKTAAAKYEREIKKLKKRAR